MVKFAKNKRYKINIDFKNNNNKHKLKKIKRYITKEKRRMRQFEKIQIRTIFKRVRKLKKKENKKEKNCKKPYDTIK